MNNPHSPTPWKIGRGEDWHGKQRITIVSDHVDELGIRHDILGAILEVRDPDDADFILRAVNSHDALVKALEFAVRQLDHEKPTGCWSTGPCTGDIINDLIVCPGCAALEQASSALSMARGEKE